MVGTHTFTLKVPPQIPSKTEVNIIISSLQIRKIQDIINTFHIFLITNLLKKKLWNIHRLFVHFLYLFVLSRANNQKNM